MNANTTRIGQAGIGLAFIGMILLLVPTLQQIIGSALPFGLITLGFLVVILSYLIDRLRIMGAEYWALGSIIVYLGTIIVSLPMFLFSFAITVDTSIQWTLAAVGLILIVLGFVTTRYELNLKLISTFKKLKIGFELALERIIHRIKTSPLIILISILVVFLVFTFFTGVEEILFPVLETMRVEPSEKNVQLTTIAMILVLTGVEARELIWTMLVFVKNSLLIGINVLFEWISRLPMYLSRSARFAKRVVASSFTYVVLALSKIHENFRTILEGLPMISIFGAIGFSIGYFITKFEGLLYLSTILFIVPAAVLFVANPDWVRRRIERVQTFSYQMGQRSKNIYRRNRNLQCRKCGSVVDPQYINCPNCGTELEYCSICRSMISFGEDFERCSICSQPIHSQHLDDWTRISSKCPWCKEEWRPK